MAEVKVFKIRNKNTGLYKLGGTPAKWSNTGKTWSASGHLKNHLRMCRNWRTGELEPHAVDWEVVEIVVEEVESSKVSVADFLGIVSKP